MAESVDAADSKSAAERCEGSSPSPGTKNLIKSAVNKKAADYSTSPIALFSFLGECDFAFPRLCPFWFA